MVARHGEDGQEKGCRLPRAGLGTGHEVSLAHDDWQGILLHWSGPLVLGHLYIEEEGGVVVGSVHVVCTHTIQVQSASVHKTVYDKMTVYE